MSSVQSACQYVVLDLLLQTGQCWSSCRCQRRLFFEASLHQLIVSSPRADSSDGRLNSLMICMKLSLVATMPLMRLQVDLIRSCKPAVASSTFVVAYQHLHAGMLQCRQTLNGGVKSF